MRAEQTKNRSGCLIKVTLFVKDGWDSTQICLLESQRYMTPEQDFAELLHMWRWNKDKLIDLW